MMLAERRQRAWAAILALVLALSASALADPPHAALAKPQYHYGASIPVTCLNRSMYVQSTFCPVEKVLLERALLTT